MSVESALTISRERVEWPPSPSVVSSMIRHSRTKFTPKICYFIEVIIIILGNMMRTILGRMEQSRPTLGGKFRWEV